MDLGWPAEWVKSEPMDEEQPDTEASAANDETQVIDGLQAGTSRQAWSDAAQDDDGDVDQPERHPWSAVTGQAATLITAGAAVATAVAVLGWITLHKDRPAPASPAPTTSPAAPAPAAPPATVIITAAPPTTSVPPAAPPPPTTTTGENVYERGSAYDKAYLDAMAREGWTCTDGSDREECGQEMLGFAHQVCSYTPQSYSFLYQIFGLPSFFGPREMRRAITNASTAYPGCVVTGTP
jgi:hypothetical protein